MMVGKSSKSRPVSTSLGWQMTTCTPSLICLAYHASLFEVSTFPQNGCADAFIAQDSLQPGSDIVFPRIYRKDLASASFGELLLDFLQESSFLGIAGVFGKIASLGDDKWNLALKVRVELRAIKCPEPIRVIWIQQERVEHRA